MSQDGLKGLYRGVTSPLAGMAAFNAAQFAAFQSFRELFTRDGVTVPRITAAGAATGAVVALIEGPMDLIKSQVQKQLSIQRTALLEGGPEAAAKVKLEYSGTGDCLKKVLAARGPLGLFQGLPATILRNMIGVGAYFGVYEAIKLQVTNHGARKATSLEVLAAGGMGGFFYWLLAYPLDVLKSVMQVDSIHPAQRKHAGLVQCAKNIVAAEGYAGFMKGIAPCLARSIPANAVGFLLYEEVRGLLMKF